jgi:peptidoglycan lytic transglycosylase
MDSEKGEATYYADSLAGNATASGEPYRPESFTAAHRTLPFGTILRVKRTDNGRVTYVKVNDRGPFGVGRVIDLSRAAARELDMLRSGVVPVRVEVLERPAGQ